MNVTTLGFRVKSGFAIAVMLRGPASKPQAVAKWVVELSDRDAAETRLPYHDGFYHEQNDARELARRIAIVKRCAKTSVAALIDDVGSNDRARLRAGLVVGSVIDPARVGNPHIRAHASEGQLFRTVLEDALRSHGVDSDLIVEKQLAAKAAADLGRPSGDITAAP